MTIRNYATAELIAELRRRFGPEEYACNQNDYERLAYMIDTEGKDAFYAQNPKEAA